LTTLTNIIHTSLECRIFISIYSTCLVAHTVCTKYFIQGADDKLGQFLDQDI